MFFIIIYIGLCFALAQLGKKTGAGSGGTFLFSLLFTPIGGLIFIILNGIVEHDANEMANHDAGETMTKLDDNNK